MQSWFRQLDTLGLSALLKDAGRELFNRDIYRWREVADVANELLDQETLAARRRLVEQMTSGSGVRKRTERHADVAGGLIPRYLWDEVDREEQLPIRGIMSTSRGSQPRFPLSSYYPTSPVAIGSPLRLRPLHREVVAAAQSRARKALARFSSGRSVSAFSQSATSCA